MGLPVAAVGTVASSLPVASRAPAGRARVRSSTPVVVDRPPALPRATVGSFCVDAREVSLLRWGLTVPFSMPVSVPRSRATSLHARIVAGSGSRRSPFGDASAATPSARRCASREAAESGASATLSPRRAPTSPSFADVSSRSGVPSAGRRQPSPKSAGRESPSGLDRASHSYLVDPASSHMLVSKTKPCMSKYERFVL